MRNLGRFAGVYITIALGEDSKGHLPSDIGCRDGQVVVVGGKMVLIDEERTAN